MSRILPTPLVFISGYANTENVFYCLNLNQVQKTILMKYKTTVPFYPCFLLFFKSFNHLIQFFLQMQHYTLLVCLEVIVWEVLGNSPCVAIINTNYVLTRNYSYQQYFCQNCQNLGRRRI